eukprot:TRINITY_DN31882_c0_g1_i1.p1 TRINITY_DN31882_c0_g1~~TRINITY_DN31882_c0_g1_i1.p1  ORF type:complete len:541 (+),score=64.57 TRINITY_DN31882_c0_g1_i1:127-1623(+)
MKELNVSTEFLDVSTENTTAESFILSQPDGERTIIMATGATSTIDGVTARRLFGSAIAGKAKIFSTELSQVPTSGVLEMLKIAKGANVLRVLDLDVSPTVATTEAGLGDLNSVKMCVSDVEVLKPARHAAEELLLLWETNEPFTKEEVEAMPTKELASRLQALTGAKLVAITSGSEGSSLAMEGISLSVPAQSIGKMVDATGAGDAYFGGIIAALWHLGTPWTAPQDQQEALLQNFGQIANAVGGKCCLSVGGLPLNDFRVQQIIDIDPALAELFRNKISIPDSPFASASATETESFSFKTSFAQDAAVLQHNAKSADNSCLQNTLSALSHTALERVYVTGVGKSGFVGRRLAASLASISIPATYVPATEWVHGDLGHLNVPTATKENTVVIALSHSGETQEILSALESFPSEKCTTIAITSNSNSTLANKVNLSVPYALPQGDCEPLGKVPAGSIVAQEAVANAMVRGLIETKGVVIDTFKKNHPGGAIGVALGASP